MTYFYEPFRRAPTGILPSEEAVLECLHLSMEHHWAGIGSLDSAAYDRSEQAIKALNLNKDKP